MQQPSEVCKIEWLLWNNENLQFACRLPCSELSNIVYLVTDSATLSPALILYASANYRIIGLIDNQGHGCAALSNIHAGYEAYRPKSSLVITQWMLC
jgi:hypothetical protein